MKARLHCTFFYRMSYTFYSIVGCASAVHLQPATYQCAMCTRGRLQLPLQTHLLYNKKSSITIVMCKRALLDFVSFWKHNVSPKSYFDKRHFEKIQIISQYLGKDMDEFSQCV